MKSIVACQYLITRAFGFSADLISNPSEFLPSSFLCSRNPFRISGQKINFDFKPSRPNILKVSFTLKDENLYGKDGNKFSRNSLICFFDKGFFRSPTTIKYAGSYRSCKQKANQCHRKCVISHDMKYLNELQGKILFPRKNLHQKSNSSCKNTTIHVGLH